MDHENIASAVFSQPPIASVGLAGADARTEYDDIAIYDSRFRAMRNTVFPVVMSALTPACGDVATDKVLGVHMVGPDAAEILQGIAIAVNGCYQGRF